MTAAGAQRVLRGSALLTIVGLAFMMWSIAAPTALPVVLAMSVGQGVGTLAFAMFGWVVVSELRAARASAAETASRTQKASAGEPPEART